MASSGSNCGTPTSAPPSSTPSKAEEVKKMFQNAILRNNVIVKIQTLREEKDVVQDTELARAASGVRGLRERFQRSRPNSISDPLDTVAKESGSGHASPQRCASPSVGQVAGATRLLEGVSLDEGSDQMRAGARRPGSPLIGSPKRAGRRVNAVRATQEKSALVKTASMN